MINVQSFYILIYDDKNIEKNGIPYDKLSNFLYTFMKIKM